MHHNNISTLTIAGSDPCSGAGLQRDLRTFADFHVSGFSVTTVLTAQNTQGVTAVEPVSAGFVANQLDALCQDFTMQATKISIVYTDAIIQVLLKAVAQGSLGKVIMDPVLCSSSGWSFFRETNLHTFIKLLLQADIVTPNMPEAAWLLDCHLEAVQTKPESAVARLHQLGIKNILLKGGHQYIGTGAPVTDYFSDGNEMHMLTHPYIPVASPMGFHGSGCVLSAAIAACLAKGMDFLPAIHQARTYVWRMMQQARAVGAGAFR